MLYLPHDEAIRAYTHTYHRNDAWHQACLASALGAGDAATGDALLPKARLYKTAFYREFLRRFDYAQALLGMVHRQDEAPDGPPDTLVSLYRGRADAPFDDGDREKLKALLPHLRQATAINFRLAEYERRLEQARCTASMLHPALILLDGEGCMVQCNAAAHALLAENDGLRLKDHRLHPAKEADRIALNRLFEPVAQHKDKDDALLYLSRPSGKKPYIAVRIRMTTHSRRIVDARRPYQVLLIHDPECGRQVNLAALRARHGLSAMECAVLEALVKVGSPKAIAAHLGKSEHTVRTHLKSLFSKTGTKRQADLIQLALAVPDF